MKRIHFQVVLLAATLLGSVGCGSPKKKTEACRPCGGRGLVACQMCAGSGKAGCGICAGTKVKCCGPCEERPAHKKACECCKAVAAKKDCPKCRGEGTYDCPACENGKDGQGKTCSACKGGALFMCALCYPALRTPCICCCGGPRAADLKITHQGGPCGACNGTGTSACTACNGSATVRCTNCGGDGRTDVHKSRIFRDHDD